MMEEMEQAALADESVDRAYQSIIPGLPDDLALRCLAKISHGYHGLLETVSKKWRDAIRSSDYSALKTIQGWCGNWLFVSTSADGISQWDAYDPDADRWHCLPSISRAHNESHYGYSCVSVCKRFLVIGGCFISCSMERHRATNDVISFDPFKKRWNRERNMQTARTDFACAVVCDKVYAAGGGNSSCTEGLADAEVYDPLTGRWEVLPPMPFPLIECFGMSIGDQFHVVGRRDYNVRHDTYVVFNPMDQRWQVVEDMWPFSKLTRSYSTVINNNIYSISEEDTLTVMDTDQMDWSTLGSYPAVVLPGHIRPLKPFGFNIIGFMQCLYVVGGMILKYDSTTRSYGIVKLNTARFCDPKILPLEWKDIQPLPRTSGGIIACAVMEE